MTTVTAPLTTITLAALVPDVVRSCVVLQPSPPPDPGEEPPAPVTGNDIYTPVAPGVTYANLPVAPTIVDTSPDQMIGCIITVADNPQGRLNALFPSAVDGDGVIDRATNDIWVYDGATWNNVGPTPGPTITATTVIPPWNETLLAVARTRTKLSVNALAYALELLTEPDPIVTTTSLSVRSVTAYVEVAATDFTFTVHVPSVASGAAAHVPAATTTTAAPLPAVSSGASALVPTTDFAFAASTVPYVGTEATVIQAQAAALQFAMPVPGVASGAAVLPPAANSTLAAAAPSIPFIFYSHSFSSAGSSISTDANLGFVFTVGGSDLAINTLEVYSPATGGSETVRIWRNSDNVLMTSATVSRVAFTWSATTISEVTLAAGVAYTICSVGSGARAVYRNPSGLTFSPEVTQGDSVINSDGSTRPTDVTGSVYVFQRFGYQ